MHGSDGKCPNKPEQENASQVQQGSEYLDARSNEQEESVPPGQQSERSTYSFPHSHLADYSTTLCLSHDSVPVGDSRAREAPSET